MARSAGLRLLAATAALALTSGTVAAQEIHVRWLGVAGFSLGDGETTLVFDPFFSRPGVWEMLFGDFEPDAEVLAPLLDAGSPAPELATARAILIGHSHYDHLGDAPWLVLRSGALLVGSATSLHIANGYGLPPTLAHEAPWGSRIAIGSFDVSVVESRHAKAVLGRVPFPGEVSEPLEEPIHAFSFVLGDARGYLVTHHPTGWRAFVLSSAAVHRPALEALRAAGIGVDLLLPAIHGRDADYAAAIVTTLRPRLVIPHHFDAFTEPLAAPDAGAPSDADDLAAFEAELHAAAQSAGMALEVRRLGLFEALVLPSGGARGRAAPRRAGASAPCRSRCAAGSPPRRTPAAA